MFLTKKGFRKILIMAIAYFIVGSLCIAAWFVFNNLGIYENFLLILGIATYLIGVLIIAWGRYAEGEGKLINLGNKLVRVDLKPAEFIEHYEMLKNADDLVIKKPSVDVLRVVSLAYDLLDDRENALATANEMIDIASDKKKNLAKLLKSSLLFSYGETEEAETLFNKIQKQKLNITCSGLADVILKSDRAIAMGDYKTAEVFFLNTLERSFPNPDILDKLICHYQLGEIYAKLQDNDKAIEHYEYCASFGGETAIQKSVSKKLEILK